MLDTLAPSSPPAPRVHAGGPAAGASAPQSVAAEVARQVEGARERCASDGGGLEVMRCIHLCVLHGLVVPAWLADDFNRRCLQVFDAHVGTWDEAFGRPWPPHTRLAAVRRHRRLVVEIHAAVWRLVMDEGRAIGRILFEEVGELEGIGASGAVVERLYYEGLRQGLANVAELRRAASAAR